MEEEKTNEEEEKTNEHVLRPKDIIITFCVAFHNVIVGANMTGPALYNYTPPYSCKGFEGQDACQLKNNFITENSTKQEINETYGCPTEYQYHGENGEISFTTEWNLVCENKMYDALSITWYFIAVAIGALVTGMVNDRYGRRLTMYGCVFSQAIIGAMISIWANSYILYVVLRCAQGLFIQGIFISVYTLMSELLPSKYTTIITAIVEIFWGLGIIILSIVSYMLPNWRHTNLVMSVAPLAVTVVSIWIVPESKVWRESRKMNKTNTNEDGKCLNERARQKKILNRNLHNKEDPSPISTAMESGDDRNTKPEIGKDENSDIKVAIDNEEQQVEETEKLLIKNHDIQNPIVAQRDKELNEAVPSNPNSKNNSGSILSALKILFSTSVLRNHLFLMMFLWFSEALSYFGITFLIPELSGNHYINLIAGGFMEIALFVILCFTISHFGRKRTMCSTYLISGICYVSAAFISKESTWAGFLQTFLVIVGKASVIGNYMCLMLCTLQLFPTQLQGISIGIGNFCSEIGIMVAPLVILLADYVWFGLPLLLFSILHIVCFIFAYVALPEPGKIMIPAKTEEPDHLDMK